MKSIFEGTWEILERTRVQTGNLAAKIADIERTDRFLCAVGSDLRRHFLLSLGDLTDASTDQLSRGLTVRTEEMIIKDHPAGRYINIECNDRAGHLAFDLIGEDLLRSLSGGNVLPSVLVIQVLSKWRRFWGKPPGNLLSHEAVIGLFGEMWFLMNWLIPLLGTGAISFWKGPSGARHDYQWPRLAIEVKATTSGRGRIHHISGMDQLLPPRDGELYVFGLRLREEANATNSINQLIESCSASLANDPTSLSLFEQALYDVGYSPLQAAEYDNLRFQVLEESLFAVRDDFPRLIESSFVHGIPPGIERVDYAINLNTFDHLCVAKKPADLETSALLNPTRTTKA